MHTGSQMEFPDTWLEITVRLVGACFLTAMLGLEREVRNKPAGLRTHMLVGLGAAAFGVLTLQLVRDIVGHQQPGIPTVDPIRIVEGLVGGLGFLGAGATIQSRGEVHGMTTAAGIWIAGAIGIGCGVGSLFVSVLTTLLAVLCLIPVRYMEHQLDIRDPPADGSRKGRIQERLNGQTMISGLWSAKKSVVTFVNQ